MHYQVSQVGGPGVLLLLDISLSKAKTNRTFHVLQKADILTCYQQCIIIDEESLDTFLMCAYSSRGHD